MTALNLYLAEARMLEARQSAAAARETSPHGFLAELLQVLKGAITPVSAHRAVLGDSISRDLGLR